jgi:GrpB-like predicted nucleotidyltransferase (UPF0157 family)
MLAGYAGFETRTTMTIEIAPYSADWPDAFRRLALRLRRALGDLALRIDHIGSTSVPGLPAKDLIDIQVTVAALDPPEPIVRAIEPLGYTWAEHLRSDHLPPGAIAAPEAWRKLFFRCPPGQRRTNLHVRAACAANQRYALLFRDYLRARPSAAAAYARVKQQLARHHPDDADAYYDVKDPVCDILIAAAEDWAQASRWQVGPTDA